MRKNAGVRKGQHTVVIIEMQNGGVIKIELNPEAAPKTVANFEKLVKEGFYDGLIFHRVINGFMIQGGDPLGNGTGGSGKNLKAEFNNRPHKRGAVSMARAADPNSADSQFFICFDDSTFLDRQYTVWGQVISGMQAVDKIKRGTGPNGMVYDPDKIISMSVVADLQK